VLKKAKLKTMKSYPVALKKPLNPDKMAVQRKLIAAMQKESKHLIGQVS